MRPEVVVLPVSRRAFLEIVLGGVLAASLRPPRALAGVAASNFKRIYGDPADRAAFEPFLENVFHLYPPEKLHALITELTERYDADGEIYRHLAERLPSITPRLSALTYAVPALRKQKAEMARQTIELLGDRRRAEGYVEIGTTGRYLNGLRAQADIRGKVWVVNDTAPVYAVEDILERGQIRKLGNFVDMRDYDEFDRGRIAPGSIELVTNYIGFHHAPAAKLDGFTHAIWRVMKPGGRLVVRDHDVDGERMDAVVGLAHDVFNAGVGLSWEQNAAQIRNFRSLADLTAYLEARGFERGEATRFQSGDPTKNALMVFTKPRGARTT